MESVVKNKKTVVTISGNSVDKLKCKRIVKSGEATYHEVDVDCFLIGEKYVSKHFNRIELDHYTNKMNWLSKMAKVVIDVKGNGELIYGYSSSSYPVGFNMSDTTDEVFCLTRQIYDKVYRNLKECRWTGRLFYGNSPIKKPLVFNPERMTFNNTVSIKTAKIRNYSTSEKLELGIHSLGFKETGGKKYTFGVEIECSDGVLSEEEAIKNNLNVLCEKDGSLTSNEGKKYGGGEFVTGILTGDAGLNQLKKVCDLLEKRMLVNRSCSVHVHIGVDDPSEEFTVYSYILAKQLETHISNYFPAYRSVASNEFCRRLDPVELITFKDYTKAHKGLELFSNDSHAYKEWIKNMHCNIFTWLSGGYSPDERYNKNTDHPKGNKCGYDHSSARYCWLNLIPCNFNIRKGKSYTIEFRIHPETTSFYKIKKWIQFCMAYVSFVEENKQLIKDAFENDKVITVEEIIQRVYNKSSDIRDELLDYLNQRKGFFSNNRNAIEEKFKPNNTF